MIEAVHLGTNPAESGLQRAILQGGLCRQSFYDRRGGRDDPVIAVAYPCQDNEDAKRDEFFLLFGLFLPSSSTLNSSMPCVLAGSARRYERAVMLERRGPVSM